MMFHPKHVLIKDEFQKHPMDHQSNNNNNNDNNNDNAYDMLEHKILFTQPYSCSEH